MKMPRLLGVGALALATGLLTACGGAEPAVQQPAAAETEAVTETVAEPAEAASPTLDQEPATEVAAQQPTDTAAPPPTVSDELRATDPTTVNLATGKPTLLEFFAFW